MKSSNQVAKPLSDRMRKFKEDLPDTWFSTPDVAHLEVSDSVRINMINRLFRKKHLHRRGLSYEERRARDYRVSYMFKIRSDVSEA